MFDNHPEENTDNVISLRYFQATSMILGSHQGFLSDTTLIIYLSDKNSGTKLHKMISYPVSN